ncbi:HAMP domain-containing sensor histidine kinase [uncultured Dokdonia sp.]|uniref:sensor histidine kinase n=1 Tax=uncultured Dokdonia sp. TaxID=575653 RepID=UPI00262128F2|nr:HAMP domain-containing sensor histidine kinase [uncultured Dokdonia sp.]
MNFSPKPQYARWFMIISSLVITTLILWNVLLFFEQLKESERSKMEIFAAAQKALAETGDILPKGKDARQLDASLSNLYLLIVSRNNTIPTLDYDIEDEVYMPLNIPNGDVLSQEELAQLAQEYSLANEPIDIVWDGVKSNTIYYGNSSIIDQLKYFPIALLLIVVLFIAIIYFYYLTSKSSAQNLLWAGMAKETAHQIGTPLSSLVGWTEILKTEDVNPDYIKEMVKDIDRLETITDRFSKIGSIPDLVEVDIIEETRVTFDYLENRSSKLIKFSIDLPEGELPVMLNKQLYGWTIENMFKNAIDAMKGKGDLTVVITRDANYAKVLISDTGKGIPKNKFNSIFEPGFTTKKRGWGLGLSLARRIIEEYHDGRIGVLKSEIDKGTTMQIQLKLVNDA